MHHAVKLWYSIDNPGLVGSYAVYLPSWTHMNSVRLLTQPYYIGPMQTTFTHTQHMHCIIMLVHNSFLNVLRFDVFIAQQIWLLCIFITQQIWLLYIFITQQIWLPLDFLIINWGRSITWNSLYTCSGWAATISRVIFDVFIVTVFSMSDSTRLLKGNKPCLNLYYYTTHACTSRMLMLSHLYLFPCKILTGLGTAQSLITIASVREESSAMIGNDTKSSRLTKA